MHLTEEEQEKYKSEIQDKYNTVTQLIRDRWTHYEKIQDMGVCAVDTLHEMQIMEAITKQINSAQNRINKLKKELGFSRKEIILADRRKINRPKE